MLGQVLQNLGYLLNSLGQVASSVHDSKYI